MKSKNFFFSSFMALAILLSFASPAHAESKVRCAIENPCGWLEPIPGVTDEHLGFCVGEISGNQKYLRVEKLDGKGLPLPSIELEVVEISPVRLSARSIDGQVSLDASEYDTFLAGGILFKTVSSPFGLGLFLTCEIEKK